MAWLRAALLCAGFLLLTFLGMPLQWLFLKLGAGAARTFPYALSPLRRRAVRHSYPGDRRAGYG